MERKCEGKKKVVKLCVVGGGKKSRKRLRLCELESSSIINRDEETVNGTWIC